MGRLTILLVCSILSWWVAPLVRCQEASETASATKDNDIPEASEVVDECGLYLAISSTSTADKANWGIYAGKEIPQGMPIGYPELGVNVHHFKANSHFAESTDKEGQQELMTTIANFFESIVWVPAPAGAKFELETGSAVTAVPGAGSIAGFNVKLTNCGWAHAAAQQRTPMGEPAGVVHPGRGAYSPFYNVTARSLTTITAGSEIFMDYGENWAEDEMEDEITKDDFTRLDETIDQMIEFFAKHRNSLDETSRLQVYRFITKDVMTAAVGANKAKKIMSLLPPDPNHLHKVKEAGGSLVYSAPTVYRTADWLKENGRCMDNIRPGPSTIPHAGRGAFASRKIKQGDLITTTPLVHIIDKSVLNMHEIVAGADDEYVRHSDDVLGQQLLMNYVYGHPDSDMVFFPAGAGVNFINHSPEPNAKMEWSSHPNHQKVWFSLDIEELMEEDKRFMGLLMDIVATKDIEPGDEIFIDYGPQWRAAWEAHLSAWNEKVNNGELVKVWPARAADLNEEYSSKPFETEEELSGKAYPENIRLKVYLAVLDSGNTGTVEDPAIWGSEESEIFHNDNLHDCTVVDRKQAETDVGTPYTYTIRWTNDRKKDTFVTNVPHQALVFVDAPGTSDQFFEHAFRHYIGIPDEIFPKGPWRRY